MDHLLDVHACQIIPSQAISASKNVFLTQSVKKQIHTATNLVFAAQRLSSMVTVMSVTIPHVKLRTLLAKEILQHVPATLFS